MIRSMTGFGRCDETYEHRKLTVEMKSVNNRYLDFNIRMPKKFAFLDAKIRSVLKEYMERGKVDVFIISEEYSDEAGTLKYNRSLAEQYLASFRMIADHCGLKDDVRVTDIARAPEVLTIGEGETDEAALWKDLEPVLRKAAQSFEEARTAEGRRLRDDLLGKLCELEQLVIKVREHEPAILEAYRSRLEETLAEILKDRDMDDARIAAECVVYADRICTDEETVRLKSHVLQMKKELEGTGGIGRKLDFLAQEMNREANTTLSKAGDLITADLGIEMKTLIEKIREQIQNIE
jgi:uncharacterized protein (TIGR00255 family)